MTTCIRWLSVVITSAIALVACNGEDPERGPGGKAGDVDSGADADGGGGTSDGGAGNSAAGAAGSGGGAAGANAGAGGGGNAGAGGTVETGAGAGSTSGAGGTVIDGGTDGKVTPEPPPEAGADAPIDRGNATPEAAPPEAAPEAATVAEAAAPEAAPAEAAAPEAAVEAGRPAATVRYGFENGLEGWTSGGTITLAASSAQFDTGAQSLAVTMTNSDYETIRVNNPPAGLAGGTWSVRIFLPTTSTLTVVKPFDYTVTPVDSWMGIDGIPIQAAGSWQTYTFTFPTVNGANPRSEPFTELGLQLRGNGVIYIDSVSY